MFSPPTLHSCKHSEEKQGERWAEEYLIEKKPTPLNPPCAFQNNPHCYTTAMLTLTTPVGVSLPGWSQDLSLMKRLYCCCCRRLLCLFLPLGRAFWRDASHRRTSR